MELDGKRRQLIFDITLLAVAMLTLFIIRKNITAVIGPFITALIIAYLLDPLVNWLEKNGIRRVIAILAVFLIIILIFTAFFMSFVPILVNEISNFAKAIPHMVDQIVNYFDNFQENLPVNKEFVNNYFDIDKELSTIVDSVMTGVGVVTSSIISGTGKLLDFIMIPIITFYYLKDKDEFLRFLKDAIPLKYRSELKAIAEDVNRVVSGFIRGQIIVAAFVGTLTGIGCKIVGLPYSLTIGMVAGVTNIIPYFGPWLGGILPVLLALITNPIKALWVVIIIVIVQQVESSFLSPQIMSHSVGLHPLAVMFSVLLFGNIFGILGMIIGVPVMGTINILVKHLNKYRHERLLD